MRTHAMALVACTFLGATLSTAHAKGKLQFELRDESKGACACAYSAPKGWGKLKKTDDGWSIDSKKVGVFEIKYTAKETNLDDSVPKQNMEGEATKREKIGDWTCAESGGANGEWEHVICGKVVDGGTLLLTVSAKGGWAEIGGNAAVAKAAATITGVPAKK